MSDNARLQALIDSARPIPAGTYYIDAAQALTLRSGANVNLSGVTLMAIPNALEKYAIILIDGNDITLRQGTIIGERKQHKGSTGEWGFGVSIRLSSDVLLLDVVCRDCWGDGFYIGGASNVTIDRCKSTGNRRQGLSIVEAKNVIVSGSTFQDTGGTRPSCGIDIEPNKGSVIDGVSITNCTFRRNAGAHIAIMHRPGTVKGVVVRNNVYDGKSVPLKVQGRDPSVWLRIAALFGDYSGYAREVKFG